MAKNVLCPVHGLIELSERAVTLIDTPQFQRLRRLRQLGNVHFVYPGANHTRFEHSLGVYHLAKMAMLQICESADDPDIELVALGGLLHDIGHGPFSHLYEEVLEKFNHEEQSCFLVDRMVKDKKEAEFIKQVIKGEDPYKLVHNPETGLDVDKMDYLMRDAYHCGKPLMCEPYRIIRGMRWIDDRVCYPVKDVFLIYQLFAARYSMFKQVYSHRAVAMIDYMVKMAMQEYTKEETLYWGNRVIYENDTDDYIWHKFIQENCGDPHYWIHRIETRKFLKGSDTPTDWQIKKRFNLSMGNRNPLNLIWFYYKPMSQAFQIDPTKYSVLIPKDFTCEEVVTYYFITE